MTENHMGIQWTKNWQLGPYSEFFGLFWILETPNPVIRFLEVYHSRKVLEETRILHL